MSRPTSEIDADLARTVHQGQRVLPLTVAFLVIVVVILLGVSGYLVIHASGERARTEARIDHNTANVCDFFRDIAVSPLPATASDFGTAILVDSRNSYIGLHCQPRLPPPSATLRGLAAKYHHRLAG